MTLAKVLGPVVSTIKNEALSARTLYVVQPLNQKRKPQGKSFLALDSVQARVGDTVLILKEGNGCRQILNHKGAAVNSIICGIVDSLD